MDNWEKLDRAFKAKVGDVKLQNVDIESHDRQKGEYVDAYKEEVRRMSVINSNAFLSAALLTTGVVIQKQPSSISCTSSHI